ncbi:MAG: hypothetical protein DLD55_01170 [candidate division SR1 bacterium]|nr:MAG: hypothetical protein DLD55_01170 [candidate division SR1 bacterium]
MNQLETLLNTLIKMGWKPWGIKADFSEYKFGKFRFIKMSGEIVRMCNLRELVSLESGLWQFCAEKGFLNSPDQYPNKDFRAKNPRPYGEMSLRWDTYYKTEVYQYRLLESALVPEEELGKFLVDNIKAEGPGKN